MTEILPGLWIGDRDYALNIDWLRKNNISVVINCTKNLPFADYEGLQHILRIPVSDNLENEEIEKMQKYLSPVTDKIQQWIPNHNILVHCFAGRQRSSAVILAYL